MSSNYVVTGDERNLTQAGTDRVYDFFNVQNVDRGIIYEVRHYEAEGLYWVKNQQIKSVIGGGETKDAIIEAIELYDKPEPEPEPEPESESEPEE